MVRFRCKKCNDCKSSKKEVSRSFGDWNQCLCSSCYVQLHRANSATIERVVSAKTRAERAEADGKKYVKLRDYKKLMNFRDCN